MVSGASVVVKGEKKLNRLQRQRGRVRLIAPVLKTGVPKGTVGPNPTAVANADITQLAE